MRRSASAFIKPRFHNVIISVNRVSSSYFFLFFEHIPIFSYLSNETYFSYFLAGEANMCYKIENEIIVMCFRRRFS